MMLKSDYLKSSQAKRIIIVSVIIICCYATVHYLMTNAVNQRIETIPKSMQEQASKMAPDQLFASQWSEHYVQADPIADKESQKILGMDENNENKRLQQNLKEDNKTINITEEGNWNNDNTHIPQI